MWFVVCRGLAFRALLRFCLGSAALDCHQWGLCAGAAQAEFLEFRILVVLIGFGGVTVVFEVYSAFSALEGLCGFDELVPPSNTLKPFLFRGPPIATELFRNRRSVAFFWASVRLSSGFYFGIFLRP